MRGLSGSYHDKSSGHMSREHSHENGGLDCWHVQVAACNTGRQTRNRGMVDERVTHELSAHGHTAARSPRPARETNIPRRKHVRDHLFQDRQSFDDYDSWASCLNVSWMECQVLRLLLLCVDCEACATPAC